MALLDRVTDELKLYIGGLFSLKRKEQLRTAEITHVLSVARMPFKKDLLQGYKHLQVEVDDVEDENLLEHFSETNRFIQDGLDGGGGVFAHCIMGKSRSATCVIAYLMNKLHISPDQGLEILQRSRPLCDPNDGFMEQLRLYYRMDMTLDVEAHPIYQRWIYETKVKQSLASGEAPGMDYIVFEDEKDEKEKQEDNADDNQKQAFDIRCRKCRRLLATSTSITPHIASEGEDIRANKSMSESASNPSKQLSSSSSSPSSSCAHIYTEPLSWMRPELERGNLSGRLECPSERCAVVVGRYAWHGQKCSCGAWMVPAFGLTRSRVDESRKTAANRKGAREVEAVALNIRMPPAASTVAAEVDPHR